MNRRGFLSACLAFGAAPAIVRASSLMPIRVVEPPLIQPIYGTIDRFTIIEARSIQSPISTMQMVRGLQAYWNDVYDRVIEEGIMPIVVADGRSWSDALTGGRR